MRLLRFIPLVLLILLLPAPGRAYETDLTAGYSSPEDAVTATDSPTDSPTADPDPDHKNPSEDKDDKSNDPNPRDGTWFDRFQAALTALDIEPEPQPDFDGFPKPEELNLKDIKANLRWIDPNQALQRYLSIDENAPSTISLYLDHYSKRLSTALRDTDTKVLNPVSNSDSESLIEELDKASQKSKNTADKTPLEGLRFMIDPGHMGEEAVPGMGSYTWDKMTGKYVKPVKDGIPGYVSEGNLNLWTAFLVANELEKLGAEVRLTRTEPKPVLAVPFLEFDPTLSIAQFFYSSFDSWMPKHLKANLNLANSSELDLIKSDPKSHRMLTDKFRKNFFHESYAQELYTEMADLDARVTAINNYQPDIFIDIHYDADNEAKLQKTPVDAVTGYVPGNFYPGETGSRRVRALALKHLLEVRRWNESVNLVGSITHAMHETLRIPITNYDSVGGALRVKEGVYARNLYVPRRVRKGLSAYLECLHYDDKREFTILANNNASGVYHEISFKYPLRLKSVANGIRNGIVDYFKNRSVTAEQ